MAIAKKAPAKAVTGTAAKKWPAGKKASVSARSTRIVVEKVPAGKVTLKRGRTGELVYKTASAKHLNATLIDRYAPSGFPDEVPLARRLDPDSPGAPARRGIASTSRSSVGEIVGAASTYASVAASLFDLNSLPGDASDRSEKELGLFLVRPASASAAQALSSFPVAMHLSSRNKQLSRLIEFRNDTRAQLADIKRWSADVTSGRRASSTEGLISTGMVMRLTADQAKSLRTDLKGVQVIQNRVLSLISPTKISTPTTVPATAGWHLEAVGQRAARANGTAFSGKGIKIAVLDTGIELTHPELSGKVHDTWAIDPVNSAVDGSAVIADTGHTDTDGHGTHVAGLICGATMGVAPGATLSSVLMMPKGFATTFDFIRCLDWVAQRTDISLLNFSAGEVPYNDDMAPIVADLLRLGVLPFFAVGNEGENNSRSPGNYIDGVSVGSVDPSLGQKVSSFSGSGHQHHNGTVYDVPDLVAPGRSVWSSYLGGGFAELDGTSMATPIACGVAACFLEQAGGLLSVTDLFDQLRRSCTHLPNELAGRQGRGLIRVP